MIIFSTIMEKCQGMWVGWGEGFVGKCGHVLRREGNRGMEGRKGYEYGDEHLFGHMTFFIHGPV